MTPQRVGIIWTTSNLNKGWYILIEIPLTVYLVSQCLISYLLTINSSLFCPAKYMNRLFQPFMHLIREQVHTLNSSLLLQHKTLINLHNARTLLLAPSDIKSHLNKQHGILVQNAIVRPHNFWLLHKSKNCLFDIKSFLILGELETCQVTLYVICLSNTIARREKLSFHILSYTKKCPCIRVDYSTCCDIVYH